MMTPEQKKARDIARAKAKFEKKEARRKTQAAKKAAAKTLKASMKPVSYSARKFSTVVRSRVQGGYCAGCGSPLGKKNMVHRKCVGAMMSEVRRGKKEYEDIEKAKKRRALHDDDGKNRSSAHLGCGCSRIGGFYHGSGCTKGLAGKRK